MKALLFAVDKNTRPIVFAGTVEVINEVPTIITFTGRVGGKMVYKNTPVPQGKNIGKANETSPLQQAQLELNSKVYKMYDKGYKSVRDYERIYNEVMLPNLEYTPDLSIEGMEKLLKIKTSTINKYFLDNNIRHNTFPNGDPMPMLALPYKNQFVIGNFAQRKLNGVRCIAFKKDGKIHLISRKGKEYNITHIKRALQLTFEQRPKVILDGELYIHEVPLGKIVSYVKDPTQPETRKLQYHIYDIIAPIKQVDRLQVLMEIAKSFMKPIIAVETVVITNTNRLHEFEKQALKEGYEGLILRDQSKYYTSGYRSDGLLKLKRFIDEEFEIVDGVLRKPGDIDTFVFICKLKDGRTFDPRPRGNREQKRQYLRDIESLKGKMATVRYQELTEYGIPHQIQVLAIRDYE